MVTKTESDPQLIEVDIKYKPTIAEEVIGPELANEYLNLAAPNRKVRDGIVAQYARDMIAKNWHSSVIRFGEDGQLWDGQHRLKAVIISKTKQMFWVERNVSLEAIHSVDVGLKRTPADMLSIAGEVNATTLGSAIRTAYHLEKHLAVSPSSWVSTPMSTEELFQYLENNPDLRDSTRYAAGIAKKQLPYPPSLAAALHYLELRRNRQLGVDFWDGFVTGANLKEQTGPFVLRNTVFNDRLKDREERMSNNDLVAISIKAWNYWEQNKPIKQLRWLTGEPFPYLGQKIKGTAWNRYE